MQINTNKFHDTIAQGLFLVLALLAVVFSWERIYVDAGYYLMRVIDSQSFWIEHQRLILIFPEWLPLLGVWLSLPIKWLVLLYSVGHVLFFYVAYLISRYTFGNQWAGYQLALVQVLGLVEGFFVPVFELYYGCGLAVIFLSMLYSGKTGLKYTIISLLLLAFTLLSHPTLLFLLAFIIGMKAIDEKKLQWNHLWMGLTAMVVLVIKRFNQSVYEAIKSEVFIGNLKNWHYTPDYLVSFSKYMMVNYGDVLFLAALVFILLLLSGKKWVALAFIPSLMVIIMLVNIMVSDLNLGRYTEQVYFPISALVILALFLIPISKLSKTQAKVIVASLLLVFSYRISLIVHTGSLFSKRTIAIQQICDAAQQKDGSKFIISEADFDAKHKATINWSLTIESLLYTATKGNAKTITICTDTDYQGSLDEGRQPTETQYLFRRWEMYEDTTLNSKYFNLAHGAYQPLDIEGIVD